MVEIVQISDLHYYSKEFRLDCLENIIEYVNDKKPDAVVCTGDLTHHARKHEYIEISELIKNIKVPMLNVIGNHDSHNHGVVFFERYVGPRRSVLKIENKDTIIIGIRSARDNTSEGEIGDEQLEWIIKQLKENEDKIKVLALHHHVVAVPSAGFKRTTLVDAGEILQVAQDYEIDLILQGHRHVPHAWIFGNSVLLYCGTSCSNKVRADDSPCFNEISIFEDKLEVRVVDSSTLNDHLLISQNRGEIDYIRSRNDRINHLIKTKIFQDTI